MMNRLFVVAFFFATASSSVHAGAEEYPRRFSFTGRPGALESHPFNSFAYEMRQLASGDRRFTAVEPRPYEDAPPVESDLPEGMQAQVAAVLDPEASSDARNKLLAELPADVRAYLQGALRWNAARSNCISIEDKWEAERRTLPLCTDLDGRAVNDARAAFARVLSLPPDQARLRGASAAYMMGQVEAHLAAQTTVTSEFEGHRLAAIDAFREVRRRVSEGAHDPQGLASASLGDEARQHLYTSYAACDWLLLRRREPCVEHLAPEEVKEAMRLYVEQIGTGSYRALNSLSTLARAVLTVPELTQALVRDPFAQSVFTPYVLGVVSATTDSGETDPRLRHYIDAIRRVDLRDRVAQAQLAALFFRQAQYVEAEQLAAMAEGPMAHWVRAKIALRSGRQEEALREFSSALRTNGLNGKPLEDSGSRRIQGEGAIVILSRGEYLEAMNQIYALANEDGEEADPYLLEYDDHTGNWDTAGELMVGDLVTYLAERVLSLDELADFIGKNAPVSAYRELDGADGRSALNLDDRLRWLLGRRMFRAGRYAEGLPFFPIRTSLSEDAVFPRKLARQYLDLTNAGDSIRDPVRRAANLFNVARMERKWGMELIGFEGAPDFAETNGNISGVDKPWGVSGVQEREYVSEIEKDQFDATAAKPGNRFHYRYRAADRAAVAAELLPPDSQAFGALLCSAARWMRDGPADLEEQRRRPGDLTEAERRINLYRTRYAEASGTSVDRLRRFGTRCDDPDFSPLLELGADPAPDFHTRGAAS